MGPKCSKLCQSLPQKALHPPDNLTQCLFQAFPGHKYPSGTLQGPSKATQYPSGPLLHALGSLKGLGRAKKGSQASGGGVPALLNINPKKKSPNLTPVGFQISLKLTPARFENGANLTPVKF